jgi:hypothetical protein
VFVSDGPEIVGFDAGGKRHVWLPFDGGHASLAVDDDHLLVADMGGKRVVRIDRRTGEAETLSDAAERPLEPALFGNRAVWKEAPFVPDPVRGAPYSTQATRLRVWEGGHARTLAEWIAPVAWDAQPTDDGVLIGVREDVKGLLRGARRAFRLRRVGWDGSIKTLCDLLDPMPDANFARLAHGWESVFVWSPGHRPLLRAEWGKKAKLLVELDDPIVAATADARGAVVITEREGRYRVLDVPRSGMTGAVEELARYEAETWHRPEIRADAYGAFFVVGHEILRAPRTV